MLTIVEGRDYTILGTGSVPVLAFHGFSQGPEVFELLTQQNPKLKIYSFSLYGHPHTFPHYAKKEWLEGIKHWFLKQKWSAFQIIAFSLGARHALAIIEEFPEMITKAVLLAPDGLSPHPIFQLATATTLGRWWFRFLLRTPIVPWVGFFLSSMKLLPPFTIKFLKQQFSSAQSRMRLYDTWIHYAQWEVDAKGLAKHLYQHQIPVGILLATKDLFIQKSGSESLSFYTSSVSIATEPCNHFYLLSHYLAHYKELPKWAILDS